MAKRAIAYIDGFNFYHGVVRDRPELKWLNFLPLCERLLRGHHLAAINYYTARVVDRPEDPRQSQRQDSYLRVLENTDRVNVVYGQFQKKPLKVATRGTNIVPMVEGGTGSIVPGTLVKATTYEEKGSDVNLATDLSFDAATNQMAVALVLTNDFDIQHAVTRAMAIGVEVIIVNPHNRTRGSPRSSARTPAPWAARCSATTSTRTSSPWRTAPRSSGPRPGRDAQEPALSNGLLQAVPQSEIR